MSEIPNRRIVASVLGPGDGTYGYAAEGVAIPLKIQHRDGSIVAISVQPRNFDNRWSSDLVRVEGFIEFEGHRTYCVATYRVGQSGGDCGNIVIYAY